MFQYVTLQRELLPLMDYSPCYKKSVLGILALSGLSDPDRAEWPQNLTASERPVRF